MDIHELRHLIIDKITAVCGSEWTILPNKSYFRVAQAFPSAMLRTRTMNYTMMAQRFAKAGFDVRYIKGKGPNAQLDDALVVRVTEKQLKEWHK